MTFGIWAMFLSIWDYCWRERAALVRFGGVPFLVVAVCTFLFPTLTKDSGAVEWTAAGVLSLIQSVCYLPVTVAWYRKVVLGDGGVSGRSAFALGRREGRLLVWQGLIMVAGLALLALAVAIVYWLSVTLMPAGQMLTFTVCGITGAVLGLAWLAALNRMGMILVLAATDQPVHFGAAWGLTRGLTWALLGTLLLLIAAGVIGGAVASLIALPFGSGLFGTWVKALVGAAVSMVTLVATATLFGFAYLKVVQARGVEPQAA